MKTKLAVYLFFLAAMAALGYLVPAWFE